MIGEDLRRRLRFDYEVLSAMKCPTFTFTAYSNTTDLERETNPIMEISAAGAASKYLLEYNIPTLIGPGQLAPQTRLFADLAVADYPTQPPAVWVRSGHTPYSPHFKAGMPVCIGKEIWQDRQGHVLLGHLVVHLGRLLNMDEAGRGGGYRGWNAEAIEYHARHYGGRPLNPELVYPALPGFVFGEPTSPSFRAVGTSRPVGGDALFRSRP